MNRNFKIKTTYHFSGLSTIGAMIYTFQEAIMIKIKLDQNKPDDKHEIVINNHEWDEYD